ncbi:MAG: chemotaxis response regulator protein-glutamate methylesterase [Candidatus Polarisedimenticolaceae bacterium]|nr:chemotaxis response regulator protein-glutamate methylesterase [Candidatus Polarisedimenticolaceae bacterium]
MTTNTIKVMIVDDSAVVRQVVSEILDSCPDIEVIATAGDPIIARRKMERCWPDVLLLDIEMPRMDGLTFLEKLMNEHPTPVVMCSTLTQENSRTSLKAFRLGAVEVVGKPTRNLAHTLHDSGKQLIQAIRTASKANITALKKSCKPAVTLTNTPKLSADVMLDKGTARHQINERIIAIGTSTGGTQALELVLSQLPTHMPGIVVVQHMPEKFTKPFAERLNRCSALEIKEGEDGDEVRPGRVIIAPGGRHMLVQPNKQKLCIAIKDGPLVSRHRPSVDVLFRSVAKHVGHNALGIIMTGMGDDGANGLGEMKETGAPTLGQDEASCVVYGMPAVAANRGFVNKEVPLDMIHMEMIAFARRSR